MLSPVLLSPKRLLFLNPLRLTGAAPAAVAAASTVKSGGSTTFVAGNKCSLTAGSMFSARTTVNFWFEVWLSFSAVNTGTNQIIFMDSGGASTKGVIVYESAGKLVAKVADGTNAVTVTTATTLQANRWYHIVVNADRAGSLTIYLDSVSDASGSLAVVTGSVDSLVFPRIASNYGVTQFFGGSISCVRHGIGTALTAAQVTTLYNAKNLLPYASLPADIVTAIGVTGACWPLNENLIGDPAKVTGATVTARDVHGSNHLTFTQGEMVTNGTFGSALGAEWTLVAGAGSIALDAGAIKITQGGASEYLRAFQAVSTVSGMPYTYSISHVNNDDSDTYMECGVSSSKPGTDPASGWVGNLADDSVNVPGQTYTGTFTATSAATYIGVKNNGSATKYGSWDNISLKCNALTAANGPNTAIASDSVGTAHGTLSGFTSTGEVNNWVTRGSDFALYFDGTDDNVVCGNLGNVTRASFDVKSAIANQKLLTLANSTATAVSVVAGTLTFGASLTASNITVDGVAKTAAEAGALINDGTWHTVAFDLTSIAASSVKLGTDSSAFGNITLDNVTFSLSGSATHTYTFSDGPQGSASPNDPVLSWISDDSARSQLNQATFSARPIADYTKLASTLGVYFDGVDDYLSTTTIPFATGESGSIWGLIATNGTLATDQTILSFNDTASATRFLRLFVPANTRNLALGVRNNDTEDILTTDLSVRDTGSTFAVISNGSATSIWIDGLQATLTVTAGSNTGRWLDDVTGEDNFVLGCQVTSAGASKFLKGHLYAWDVTSQQLSRAKIRALANWARSYGVLPV